MSEENGEVTAQAEEVAESAAAEETTETEAEETETPEDQEQESDAEEEEEAKPRRKNTARQRINQLTWELNEQKRRADALERKFSDYEQSAPSKAPDRPTLESCGYDENLFNQRLDDYYAQTLDSKVGETLSKRQKQEAETRQQQELTEKTRDFMLRGSDIADDFMDVVANPNLPIPDSMRDALLAVDKGPEVIYNLAKNPVEYQRIASLSPYAQAVEIGRLSERMTLTRTKKTSSAPSPIKPLNSMGEGVGKNPDEMSVKEWQAWREKSLKR